MTFYHATSHSAWEAIQQEGVLFGRKDNREERYTFLALDKDYAKHFGSVMLQVEYEPYDEYGKIKEGPDGTKLNDYDPNRWSGKNKTYQIFKVFEPIDIKNVKVIKTC